MDRMKDDMAGGAAVVAAMRAIALLKLPIRVIGVVPTTENMPGGRAIKPGDVLRGATGKTVEVINTDAEGRLILGDGLWYARQLGATHLVDVATLTGACVVALGKITTGLFGTPQPWVEHGRAAAAIAPASGLAAAAVRRLPRAAEERDRRLDQQPAAGRRGDHRRAVPEGVRRRRAVGPPRHRRHRLGRGRASRSSPRAPPARCPHARRAGARRLALSV